MINYDKALELAKEYNTEPILDLISWSENYSWQDSGNPLNAFYAIVGVSMFDDELGYSIKPDSIFGYLEISYLAKALECFSDRPHNVRDFIAELTEMEQSMG
jgi:hypothetical protein